jgi:3-oxoadipate enol-lactonase
MDAGKLIILQAGGARPYSSRRGETMSFASIDGVSLHYRISGVEDGAPLILINSLGTNFHIWDDVLPLLDQRFRVLTYDKRGHGISDAPAGPYSLDEHVDDLLGLAARCGFSAFNLCGISIGGMIAMRVAAKYPEQVRSLVLCDTGPTIGTAQLWNERITTVERAGMAAIADQVLARWVSPGYRERRPADFAGWRNMLERCPSEGYVASCASVRDADLSADAPRISAPTLVVVGGHDVSTPPETARLLSNAITGARLKQVPCAGHVPAIEQPDALAVLIREHLSEFAHV